MPSLSTSLVHLCRCLRGQSSEQIDWVDLISLANSSLTTPALKEFCERFPERYPNDVKAYLNEIFGRNVIRNERLLGQLFEAVSALNHANIKPVLLKGAAILASARDPHGARIVADLDILVSPEESEVALNSLLKLGYVVHARAEGCSQHWYATAGRSQDVGLVDLHVRLPGPEYFYRPMAEIKRHCRLRPCGGGLAYVPDPTFHAFILIIHDQFHDADYWSGRIDLRHLLDLRSLANSPEGIDWRMLASFASGTLARNALETQLVTLFALLKVGVPIDMRERLVPRVQHWRRMAQLYAPALRWILLAAALLVDIRNYWSYRTQIGAQAKSTGQLAAARTGSPTKGKMRYLRSLLVTARIGKL